jgi:hypothetical protein
MSDYQVQYIATYNQVLAICSSQFCDSQLPCSDALQKEHNTKAAHSV